MFVTSALNALDGLQNLSTNRPHRGAKNANIVYYGKLPAPFVGNAQGNSGVL